MRISAINNQQYYNNKVNFQSKTQRVGTMIGGLTGLMMTGAMIASCPVDWHKIKTWPIVAISLTAGGAMEGKMIANAIDEKNNKNNK